jgi:hypothetical protein
MMIQLNLDARPTSSCFSYAAYAAAQRDSCRQRNDLAHALDSKNKFREVMAKSDD